jgi:glyoxylase-like metal-dependent hydrolase (beta-lactamase superfamily II)
MFGNVPRALWEKWIPPDEKNRIPLACRCLLVRDAGRLVLLETGIGAFFEPALRERYGVVEDRHVLGAPLRLVFPRATYVVGVEAWRRALSPHPRDRASFIPGLTDLLSATGRLEIVEGDRSATLGDGYRFHLSSGHTPGLMLTEIEMPAGPVVFAADLIPGRAWVHLPITMGYDRYPELLIDEKAALLGELEQRGGRLFFTHDPSIALGKVARDERGRYHTVDEAAELRGLAA